MKKNRITVMWMPSVSSKSRTFSVPPVLLFIFVGLLVVSWVLLAAGGYLGNRLYHDYRQLREENSYLVEKESELDALRQTMERIQKDENTIRNFLGLDRGKDETSGLGQGGEPSPDLSTIAPNDAMASGSMQVAAKPRNVSSLQPAQRLETDFQELVEIIRKRLMQFIFDESTFKERVEPLIEQIAQKKLDPYSAADEILGKILK